MQKQPWQTVSLLDGKLVFKMESEQRGRLVGPLYVYDSAGKHYNWKDSDVPHFAGGFHAAWVTVTQARQIARKMRLPLEEV